MPPWLSGHFARRATAVLASAWLVLTAGQDDALTPRDNLAPSSAGTCHLANLFLHSMADAAGSAQPIDVTAVPGVPQAYRAAMDYNMAGFDVEATAVPRGSCQVTRMSTSAIMVDPGSYVVSELFVEPTSGDLSNTPQTYSVNVSRLTGQETELHSLSVRGSYLVPPWKPSVRTYSVNLNLDEDFVRIDFQKLDNGQTVALSAGLEAATAGLTSGRRLRLSADGTSSEKVPPIGEVQRATSTLMTTIDVGHERLVRLEVTAADGSISSRYYMTVRRPSCPEERRFFDGQAKICTDICNEGFYGSTATGRCSRCMDRKCAVCEPNEGCSLCLDGFELQNGGCVPRGAGSGMDALKKVEDGLLGYERKHQVLMVGAAVVLAVALCACATFVYGTNSGGLLRLRKPRLLGGEDDEDEMSNFGYYEDSSRG